MQHVFFVMLIMIKKKDRKENSSTGNGKGKQLQENLCIPTYFHVQYIQQILLISDDDFLPPLVLVSLFQ